jgi:hypothetical protein
VLLRSHKYYDKELSKLDECGTFLPGDFRWSTTAGLRHYIPNTNERSWGHHRTQNTHQHQWSTAARGLHFDPDELYAPIADKGCIRLVLAPAAIEYLAVRHGI